MIQRKAHNRHAPVPENYEPTPQRKSYVTKPVEEKPLRLSSYWMEMYEHTFKRWGE